VAGGHLGANLGSVIRAAIVHNDDAVTELGRIAKRPPKVSVGRCFVASEEGSDNHARKVLVLQH